MEFTLSSRTRGLLIQIREAIFQLKGWEIGWEIRPVCGESSSLSYFVYQEITAVKAQKLVDGR